VGRPEGGPRVFSWSQPYGSSRDGQPPKRCWRTSTAGRSSRTGAPGASPSDQGGGGLLAQIGGVFGTIFGTSRPRGTRLTTGQLVTREITRSVSNRVAGQIAADLGKSLGGSMGGSIGRAIVRGTLGGILRR